MIYTLENQQKSTEFLGNLVQKAWESATFKEQLINNPVEAIGQVTGKDLSFLGDRKIIVQDQTDESAIYINIPAKPKMEDLELNEEQLELIAGGATPLAYAAGVALGIGVCWLVSKL